MTLTTVLLLLVSIDGGCASVNTQMYYYDFNFPLDPPTLFYARNVRTLSPPLPLYICSIPPLSLYICSLSLSLSLRLFVSRAGWYRRLLLHMASWLTEPNLPTSICCVAVLRFDGESTSTLCLGAARLLLQLGTIGLAF